jgi:glycosyltransferase involved in cell wall biosynthesis
MGKVSGIIWVGPVFEQSGYGTVSRNYVLGLSQVGFPVKAVNFGRRDDSFLDPSVVRQLQQLLDTDVGYTPVGVVHRAPEYFPYVRFSGVFKRIGCTIFETHRIPSHWVKYCNQMDEIWVPSRFNVETFSASGVDRRKLRVIPYGVDIKRFKPAEPSPIQEKRRFCFLYIFAFDWRKGFDILLEAYIREFFNHDDVTLILKTYWEKYSGIQKNQIRLQLQNIIDRIKSEVGKTNPHILIVDHSLSEGELMNLYANCNLYISTDRANGWGMSCLEVMAMGKPAATINWSGSTQFMHSDNCLLIQPRPNLVPVDNRLVLARPELYMGQQYADVTVDEVRRVMRFAYEHPQELHQIAEKGFREVCNRYNLEAIAGRIVEHLHEVTNDWKETSRSPKVVIQKYSMARMKLSVRRILYAFLSKLGLNLWKWTRG